MHPTAIRTDSLSVFRGRAAGAPPVLRDLTLTVEPRERVALIGPNGAGKTSLLLALIGAVPYEGTIHIGSELLCRENLEAQRRRIGFVFSDPQDQLFLPSVREEVAFGPEQRGITGSALDELVTRALAQVSLTGFEGRAPSALSLGEQRRLAIASVLSCGPALLLLDEPTASLDPRARRSMIETIAQLDATVLCATHDLDAALDLDARVLLLTGGRMLADGPAGALLRDEALLQSAQLELPLGVSGARNPR
jgi:energy-coupling factor transporter ATP-binding protein EcfA2